MNDKDPMCFSTSGFLLDRTPAQGLNLNKDSMMRFQSSSLFSITITRKDIYLTVV